MGQELKKYHVADDGSIYQINDDGSCTSIGNINSFKQQTQKPSNQNYKILWWMLGVLFIANISICCFVYYELKDRIMALRIADDYLIRYANEWSEAHFNSNIYCFDYFDDNGYPEYFYTEAVDTIVADTI